MALQGPLALVMALLFVATGTNSLPSVLLLVVISFTAVVDDSVARWLVYGLVSGIVILSGDAGVLLPHLATCYAVMVN